MRKAHFDLPVLLISVGTSVLWGVLGNFLYGLLFGKVWGPILVGMFFLGLSGVVFLSMVIAASLRNGRQYVDLSFSRLALIAGAITLAAFLFEIIYEISPAKREYHEPTGYAFLIDDSGSMSINDPENSRNPAISFVMASCEKEFPYTVYGFDTACQRIMDVLPAKEAENVEDYGFLSYGGTNVLGAISSVTEDVASGKIDLGPYPRIILFSDGISDAGGMNSVLEEMLDQGISISCVGFGDADSRYLSRIANGGGGVYISIDQITDLAEALKEAGISKNLYQRNLLNYRGYVEKTGLYIAMRIIFMLLLGAGFVVMKVAFFYTRDDHNWAFIVLCALTVISAAGMEFGIENLVLDERLMRMLLCVGFGLLMGFVTDKNGPVLNNSGRAMGGNPYGNTDPGFGSKLW